MEAEGSGRSFRTLSIIIALTLPVAFALIAQLLLNEPPLVSAAVEQEQRSAVSGQAQIFIDDYEPNDSIQAAYQTIAQTSAANLLTCASATNNIENATLWPVGDADFFRFETKANRTYTVTVQVDEAASTVDPFVRVFGPNGNQIGQNDDYEAGQRDAQFGFLSTSATFYYFEVTNVSNSDPAGQIYCATVKEGDPPQLPPTQTPTPTVTPLPSSQCEPNNRFETACLLAVGETKTGMNLVPPCCTDADVDIYQMWVRQGLRYECTATIPNTASGNPNDTYMIFYDANRNQIGYNEDIDKANGNFGSWISQTMHYEGWLYIQVAAQVPVIPDRAKDYTYNLTCKRIDIPPPTNTPLPPLPPAPSLPMNTPTPPEAALPTQTPIDPILTSIALTAQPPAATPRPVIQVVPVSTPDPGPMPEESFAVDVTLYYDANENFLAELNEGIMEVRVAVYDAFTGQLLSVGSTNEAGQARFNVVAVNGTVRVFIPFLSYSQTVTMSQPQVTLRVAPRTLPGGIP